jgi:hypothetical protein
MSAASMHVMNALLRTCSIAMTAKETSVGSAKEQGRFTYVINIYDSGYIWVRVSLTRIIIYIS